MAKILVVEDDALLTEAISELLRGEDYKIDTIANGNEASSALRMHAYDLIILDWTLPGLTGVELCRQLRGRGNNAPILMLTAHSDISDKETGFNAGADDYLTKPFNPRELKARVKSLLRRQGVFTGDEYRAGNIVLDCNAKRVTVDGKEVRLIPIEFALLELFMRYPNKVFSTDALMDRIWSTNGTPEAVRTSIKRLRQKIDTPGQPSLLKTLHGMGYRLEAP